MSEKKGRAVTLTGEREVEIVEVEEFPEVEDDAVFTEVVRTNVCGSELHYWRDEFKFTGVLGHEAVLRVKELGDDVSTDSAGNDVEEGDLITPVYFIPCGECAGCSNGQLYACELVKNMGHWMQPPNVEPYFNGTFATHFYVRPDQNFYKVPENVPDHVAASANCALSQVMFALDEANLRHTEDVVIQGAGGLGLHATAIAKETGANVIAIDQSDTRLERIKEFGADHVIDMREHETPNERSRRVQELTGGDGADVGVEVAGVPDAFVEGIHHLRNGARYVELGNIATKLSTEFNPSNLTLKNITVLSRISYPPHYLGRSLEFLSKHVDDYPYEDLLDAEFSLEETQKALEMSDAKEVSRASIVPER